MKNKCVHKKTKLRRRAAERVPTIANGTPVALEVTFEPFNRLPRELRDHIWDISLPGARGVAITGYFDPANPRWLRFRCFNTPPAQLSVYKESRERALRKYTACLNTPGFPHVIRFDPFDDTMLMLNYLEPAQAMATHRISNQALAQIRNLTVLERQFYRHALPYYYPNIQKLFVVHFATRQSVQAAGGRPEEGFKLCAVLGRYGNRPRLDAKKRLEEYRAFSDWLWKRPGVPAGRVVPEIVLSTMIMCKHG